MNFDMIKYLPGYKGILKAVLKMQIQQLVFDFFLYLEMYVGFDDNQGTYLTFKSIFHEG